MGLYVYANVPVIKTTFRSAPARLGFRLIKKKKVRQIYRCSYLSCQPLQQSTVSSPTYHSVRYRTCFTCPQQAITCSKSCSQPAHTSYGPTMSYHFMPTHVRASLHRHAPAATPAAVCCSVTRPTPSQCCPHTQCVNAVYPYVHRPGHPASQAMPARVSVQRHVP